MAYEVTMPQMGESIAEGTVTTWLKAVGDRVQRDEPLFEISTDKVDAEIPAPAAGVLAEIRVQAGTTVPIHTVVAVIREDGAVEAPSAPAAAPESKPEQERVAPPRGTRPEPLAAEPEPRGAAPEPRGAAPEPSGLPPSPTAASLDERRRTRSSPVVRRIATEHGIDISKLQGSGADGRVTRQDILAEVARRQAPAPEAVVAPPAPPPPEMIAALSLPNEIPAAFRPRALDGDRIEELSTMRAKIAEHMTLSRRIAAHVSTVWEIDFTHLAELRSRYKQTWAEKHGVHLTYNAFVLKAAVDALKAFPMVNASLDGRRVIYHRDINLGMAVALDWGLIVPVIHKADELNLLGLARRAEDLAARARSKKLLPNEVQNGTFSVTNPGLFGSLFGLPVINQPQVAILGVGTIEKRPAVIDDMIAIRTRCYISLSFDHRLIDGALADQFMARFKKAIEELDEAEL